MKPTLCFLLLVLVQAVHGASKNPPAPWGTNAFPDVIEASTDAAAPVEKAKVLAAARFVPHQLTVVRRMELVGSGGGGSYSSLKGEIVLPRPLAPSRWGEVALQEARDATGASLVPGRGGRNLNDNYFMRSAMGGAFPSSGRPEVKPGADADMRHPVQLMFKAPEWTVREIDRIKGSLSLRYPGSTQVLKLTNAIPEAWVRKAGASQAYVPPTQRQIQDPRLSSLDLALQIYSVNTMADRLMIVLGVSSATTTLLNTQLFDADGKSWPTESQSQGDDDNTMRTLNVRGQPKPPFSLAIQVSRTQDTIDLPVVVEHIPLHASSPSTNAKPAEPSQPDPSALPVQIETQKPSRPSGSAFQSVLGALFSGFQRPDVGESMPEAMEAEALGHDQPVVDAGPGFLAEAQSLTLTTLHRFPDAPRAGNPEEFSPEGTTPGLQVDVRIFPPRGKSLKGAQDIKVVRALDDRGQEVRAAQTSPFGNMVSMSDGSEESSGPAHLSLGLELPQASARSLETLEAEATLVSIAQWRELTVPNLRTGFTNDLDLASLLEGARLAITEVTTRQNQCTINATVTGPAAVRYIEFPAPQADGQPLIANAYDRQVNTKNGRTTRKVVITLYGIGVGKSLDQLKVTLRLKYPDKVQREKLRFQLVGLDFL